MDIQQYPRIIYYPDGRKRFVATADDLATVDPGWGCSPAGPFRLVEPPSPAPPAPPEPPSAPSVDAAPPAPDPPVDPPAQAPEASAGQPVSDQGFAGQPESQQPTGGEPPAPARATRTRQRGGAR